MKKFLAEFIGTYALIFCGTGAIIINDLANGTIGHLGIAITFGLVVTVMIYSFGPISGAHINPAVSIAFSLTDRYDKKNLLSYIFAQCLGAIIASFSLHFLFPSHQLLGATLPAGSWQQSFVLEIILTYFLMLIILQVSQNKTFADHTPAAVGAAVLLEALFAGPISGASMNPARSLGPALISGEVNDLWIYLIAPVIGAALASWTWKYFKS